MLPGCIQHRQHAGEITELGPYDKAGGGAGEMARGHLTLSLLSLIDIRALLCFALPCLTFTLLYRT